MIKIINPKKPDQSKVNKKWLPLIEKIIDTSKYTKDQLDQIALYCEYHSIKETEYNNSMSINQVNSISQMTSLLPVALKTIAKLNITPNIHLLAMHSPVVECVFKNKELVKQVGTIQCYKQITATELKNDFENTISTTASDLIAEALNKAIKNGSDIIFLYSLINSVDIISEDTFAPKLTVKSRVDFTSKKKLSPSFLDKIKSWF